MYWGMPTMKKPNEIQRKHLEFFFLKAELADNSYNFKAGVMVTSKLHQSPACIEPEIQG